ncbi:hypothetical protein FNF31_02470 [Cafeteria roenbergensis]|uniref:CDP-diacylglycerol--glycerol-3-phosphate 3-phosphatidyltransferase n=1 Tax=Cafeteria roenbergensis TaxID=33653 RepID=A0A5A8DI43_CAFRO|nr:hypothetical protein FNF31_02470 [Cafeteria roenbergensis]KAA0165002.1 hypothetical protein FNF28_03625 [Cafeteria roenbergensis]
MRAALAGARRLGSACRGAPATGRASSSLAAAAHGANQQVVRVPDGSVSALTTPADFFSTLVERVAAARDRVSLVSLYVGDGPLEQQLMRAVSSCEADVLVAMDATRGRRAWPGAAPADFVWSTLAASPPTRSACLALLEHPAAGRWPRNRMGSGRLRESAGTQHIKAYAADGWACVAGANLSTDYFTGRQDRYLVTDSPPLAGVYHAAARLLAASPAAHTREAGATVTHEPAAVEQLTPGEEGRRLQTGLAAALEAACGEAAPQSEGAVPVSLAWQCGMLGLRDDQARLEAVLAAAGEGWRVDVATGYCNMPDHMVGLLAAAARRGAAIRVLTASPAANGFLGARSIPAALPLAYSLLLRAVARRLSAMGVLHAPSDDEPAASVPGRVSLVEWTHPLDHHWAEPRGAAGIGTRPPPDADGPARRTFHGKGLWVERGGEVLTAGGSSNFGCRSFDVDVELQTWVGPVAAESATGTSLLAERDALFAGEAAVPVGLRELEQPGRLPSTLSQYDTGQWVRAGAVLVRQWM